jgi:hypothetical protein
MAPTYEVLLDGVIVMERIVAFDPAAGTVDFYQTDDRGGIVIRDGMPVISRRTGSVTVDWIFGDRPTG